MIKTKAFCISQSNFRNENFVDMLCKYVLETNYNIKDLYQVQ